VHRDGALKMLLLPCIMRLFNRDNAQIYESIIASRRKIKKIQRMNKDTFKDSKKCVLPQRCEEMTINAVKCVSSPNDQCNKNGH
jgi:hypothetical protein